MNILEIESARARDFPVRRQDPEVREAPTTNSDPTCDLNDLLDFHWRRLP